MGINKQSDIEANLQIGPTDIGMVRIYVSAGGTEIPMDFDPEEADEISEEITRRSSCPQGDKKASFHILGLCV